MKIAEMFKERMTKDRKQYYEWHKQASKKLRQAEVLTEVLPEMLDKYVEQSSWSGTDLYISIPWNPKICDEICLALEKAGWYQSFDWKTDNPGQKPQYYIHHHHRDAPGFDVIVKMSSGDENSTCKLVQVGTEMVEKPVWQVQCADDFDVEDL